DWPPHRAAVPAPRRSGPVPPYNTGASDPDRGFCDTYRRCRAALVGLSKVALVAAPTNLRLDLITVLPPDVPGTWSNRNDQDHQDDRDQVLVDARNGIAEYVAGHRDPDSPDQATEDVVREELAIG